MWFKNSFQKGVVLIEVLLAMGIIILVVSLTLPAGISFYQTQQLDSAAQGVKQALRRAQLNAYSQSENDYGVYVGAGETGQYSLFQGSSYAGRTDEEIFVIMDEISISGLSEVIFNKKTGLPKNNGDINLNFKEIARTININLQARISLETD